MASTRLWWFFVVLLGGLGAAGLAGCGGGGLSADQVQQVRATLLSDANEAQLLTAVVDSRSSLGAYVDEHAGELADDVRSQRAALTQEPAAPEQRQRAEQLSAEAERLAGLIDQLRSPGDATMTAALRLQIEHAVQDISTT